MNVNIMNNTAFIFGQCYFQNTSMILFKTFSNENSLFNINLIKTKKSLYNEQAFINTEHVLFLNEPRLINAVNNVVHF